MFDRRLIGIGVSFVVLSVILLAILILKPYDNETMATISLIATTIAFIVSFIYSMLALKLYGRKSSEGKFWFFVVIMLLILFTGSIVDVLHESLKFSYFAAVAFFIITYAILEKINNAGVKAKKLDYAIAIVILLGIIIFISLVMILSDGQAPVHFEAKNYLVEFTVVILSLISTFFTVILGRTMGGHISKGWYFLAMGAGLFAISFTFISIAEVFGLYYDGHFLDAFNIIALNAVTFSAYYQRKKHLELIADMM